MKKSRFTLLELLIVIAVISILFTLLLPALRKSREFARSSLCMNNTKQCGTGISFYSNDFNSYLTPYSMQGWGYPTKNNTWSAMLIDLGYIRGSLSGNRLIGPSVFRCSSYPTVSNGDFAGSYVCTYGYISSYDTASGETKSKFVKAASISNPSSRVWLGDSYFRDAQQYLLSGGFGIYDYYESQLRCIHARHSGKANVWFLDGHAVTAPPKVLAKYADGAGLYYYPENAVYDTPLFILK